MPHDDQADHTVSPSPRTARRLNPFAELDLDDLGRQRRVLRILINKRIRSLLEHSDRFDMAIELDASFRLPITHFAQEIICRYKVRDGKKTKAQIEKTISIVAANLFSVYLRDPEMFIGISLGPQYYKANRYTCQGIGFDNLRRTINYLRDRDPPLIDFIIGRRFPDTNFARATRIRPNDDFFKYFLGPRYFGSNSYKNDLSVHSIALSREFELIRLKGRKKKGRKPRIDYVDTTETEAMRSQLKAWNDFLALQWVDIYLTDAQFRSVFTNLSKREEAEIEAAQEEEEPKPRYLDWKDRRLYRVFNNGSFEDGGRFYGGWWQYIPSKWRPYITINGHPAWESDFSHMQPAILYALADQPLERYAYEIDGIELTDKNKDAIKRTFFKLIYSEPGQRIAPLESDELPQGWTWTRLLEAVQERHAPINQYLRSGIAPKIQRIDSDIAEDVMLSMMKRNILVLPIHDSFMVRKGFVDRLNDEMRRAYRKRLGTDIDLKIDPSFLHWGPPQGVVISAFERMDAVIEEQSAEKLEGGDYASYYKRKHKFLSSKTAEWFYQFDPK
jgi:hypothetical protein